MGAKNRVENLGKDYHSLGKMLQCPVRDTYVKAPNGFLNLVRVV
jgi:hypothetical protein